MTFAQMEEFVYIGEAKDDEAKVRVLKMIVIYSARKNGLCGRLCAHINVCRLLPHKKCKIVLFMWIDSSFPLRFKRIMHLHNLLNHFNDIVDFRV